LSGQDEGFVLNDFEAPLVQIMNSLSVLFVFRKRLATKCSGFDA